MNETNVADLLSGLVGLTGAIPNDLNDANGDPVADCLMQSLADLADELDVSSIVRWDSVDKPANVAVIGIDRIKQIRDAITTLLALGENLPA